MNHESTLPMDAETPEQMAEAADEQDRGLTRRQRRVLKWLAEGKDIDDIAERLDRDPEQLALRIRELLAKLGVDSAKEALELPDLNEPDEDEETRRRPGQKRRDGAQPD